LDTFIRGRETLRREGPAAPNFRESRYFGADNDLFEARSLRAEILGAEEWPPLPIEVPASAPTPPPGPPDRNDPEYERRLLEYLRANHF
jgi:hypothetical protein